MGLATSLERPAGASETTLDHARPRLTCNSSTSGYVCMYVRGLCGMHAAWLQSPFVNSKAVRETRTSSLRAGHLGVNWPTHIQGMERGVRGYLVSFFSLLTRLSGVGMFCIYAGIPVRFCCSRKRMQNAGMLDDGGVRAQGGWGVERHQLHIV